MSLILVGSFEEEEEMIRRISGWLEIYAGGGMRLIEVLPLSLEGEPRHSRAAPGTSGQHLSFWNRPESAERKRASPRWQ